MAPNAIKDEEKAKIKPNLLRTFDEPMQQIALQIAVLVGKIARYDVPKEWPELIPSLLEAIQSDSDIIQHRSLLVLHHTVKALSSKRLAADRRAFHEMVEQLMPYLLQIWHKNHSLFGQQVSNGDVNASSVALEKSILALKVRSKS